MLSSCSNSCSSSCCFLYRQTEKWPNKLVMQLIPQSLLVRKLFFFNTVTECVIIQKSNVTILCLRFLSSSKKCTSFDGFLFNNTWLFFYDDVLRAIFTQKNIWVPKIDSNTQPSDRQWDALTIELLGTLGNSRTSS